MCSDTDWDQPCLFLAQNATGSSPSASERSESLDRVVAGLAREFLKGSTLELTYRCTEGIKIRALTLPLSSEYRGQISDIVATFVDQCILDAEDRAG